MAALPIREIATRLWDYPAANDFSILSAKLANVHVQQVWHLSEEAVLFSYYAAAGERAPSPRPPRCSGAPSNCLAFPTATAWRSQ